MNSLREEKTKELFLEYIDVKNRLEEPVPCEKKGTDGEAYCDTVNCPKKKPTCELAFEVIRLRNRIVELNLYLADILSRKFAGKGIDTEDLYQVASMGLVYAVERFDPEKGFEFSTFATSTIIGEIKRYFRDKGWAMKVPRKQKELYSRIPDIREEFERKNGRQPTAQEIATILEVSPEEVLEAMESGQAYGTYSLQQTFASDGEKENPALEKYASREDKSYASFENADFIRSVVSGFPEDLKAVFRHRFLEEKTQSEIAAILGISQMSVSRMEKKIREKFKEEFY